MPLWWKSTCKWYLSETNLKITCCRYKAKYSLFNGAQNSFKAAHDLSFQLFQFQQILKNRENTKSNHRNHRLKYSLWNSRKENVLLSSRFKQHIFEKFTSNEVAAKLHLKASKIKTKNQHNSRLNQSLLNGVIFWNISGNLGETF